MLLRQAPSGGEAVRPLKAWQQKWQVEEERAFGCLQKDLHHCLGYYSFPERAMEEDPYQQHAERDFREVRRRLRPEGFFANEDSAQTVFYGVTNGIYQRRHHGSPMVSAQVLT